MTVQTASPRIATPARRYIANETALGIVINLLMAAAVTLLTNRAEAFNGSTLGYVASDMAKATFFPILAFGCGLTFATRKRMSVGAVTPLVTPATAWSPRNLLVRLLLLSAVAFVVLGAPATLALHALGSINALTPLRLMLFKLAFGALIGILATPVVLTLALQDRPRNP